LPYIEQENTYRSGAQGAPISLYLCPSRGRAPALPVPASDPVFPGITYGSAGLNPWSTTDYAGNGYLLINRWGDGGVPVAGLPLICRRFRAPSPLRPGRPHRGRPAHPRRGRDRQSRPV